MDEQDLFAAERALKDAKQPPGAPAFDFSQGLPPTGFAKEQPPPRAAYHGTILPFSRDSGGNFYFDPLGAGPIGALRQAFTLPGRVMSGETPMPRTFDPASGDPNIAPIMGEALNFAGAFGPGINPMVRSGDRAIPGVAKAPKDMTLAKTPTSADLLERGGSQIEDFSKMPIRYNPSYMGTLASQIEQKLVDEGVFPEDAKGLYATIRRLRDYVPRSDDPTATINVGPANLISIRKNIANKFGQQGENQRGVSVAHEAFNDFLENPPAEAVLGGTPPTPNANLIGHNGGPVFDPTNLANAQFGAQIYKEGRGNYSAGMRDAELEQIQREAGMRSRSANSGQNLDNSLRSRITNAILNAKRLKGFTPEEEAMLEGVPEGSLGNNMLRWAGNLFGGGGGLGAGVAGTIAGQAAAAAGLGNVGTTAAAVGVPTIGAMLKRAAGKSTSEALGDVQQATRQRSPLFEQTLPGQDLVPDVQAGRDAMAQALMRIPSSAQGVPVEPDPTQPRRLEIDTTNWQ
jgi:hypothetical protein